MRLWVHVIWLKKNPTTPLALCGPKEDRKLEYLIHQYGEDKIAYAWYLYVNAKPAPYNLRPVTHVDKFTTKTGNIMATKVRDTSSITRFPLSAFLAVEDGFTVQSCLHLDALNKAYEQAQAEGKKGNDWFNVRVRYVALHLGLRGLDSEEKADEIVRGIIETAKAQKTTTASIKNSWGVTQKDLEGDADDDEF